MKFMFWENGVKAHLVPDELESTIYSEIKERFCAEPGGSAERTGTFRIDFGGPMLMSAKWVAVDLGDFTLEVPVRDIEGFWRDLSEATRRGLAGAPYYKLHSWLHVIVLTASQREQLLSAWGDQKAEARAEAEREEVRYRKAVIEANRHPGIQLTVPKTAAEKNELN